MKDYEESLEEIGLFHLKLTFPFSTYNLSIKQLESIKYKIKKKKGGGGTERHTTHPQFQVNEHMNERV